MTYLRCLRSTIGLLAVLCIITSLAAGSQGRKGKRFKKVEDDPKLPRVLLIGDSISIGYTVPVREALKGVANVHRPGENCSGTKRGLERIDKWLGNSKWDVVHFNWGLHDLKYQNEQGRLATPRTGKQQTPIEEYEKNLEVLVKRLEQTGAKLIFATTTPVPEGSAGRVVGDADKYNAAARIVMDRHGVMINDLNAFAEKMSDDCKRKANVHYTRSGSQRLGKQVADVIRGVLAKKVSQKRVEAMRRTGDTPHNKSLVTASKTILLVANKHDDTLCFIDPDSLRILQTIPTGPNPHEIIVTPDQRTAYLSNYAPPGNTISVIDLVHGEHVLQIPTGKFTRIHGTAMAPDGKHAYFTAGQTGYVVEVDTRTNKVTRGIPTHGRISHMVLVSRDGKRIYTANIVSENVSVIDRASGELITQIPCGKGCEGMAFTPDGKYLWVGNQTGGSITIVQLATHKPIKTFACPGMPVRIRFTDDGKTALVPSWTKEGQLIVIDTKTLKEIKRIKVGSFAIGVELSRDGKRAFVGCEHDDGLHVIDMKTLSVEKILKTGNGPDPMVLWKVRATEAE